MHVCLSQKRHFFIGGSFSPLSFGLVWWSPNRENFVFVNLVGRYFW